MAEEKFDFYKMGRNHAEDNLAEMKKKALNIEKTYGKAAKADFVLGFITTISEYSKVEAYDGMAFDPSTVENGIKGRKL